MNKARALLLEIYKCKYGDCSNGGISSKYNEILLLCDEGNMTIDLDNPPENLCKLVKREVWGGSDGIHTHVEPYAKPNGVGWMAGGCIVDTSDSRFTKMKGHHYPVKLHDRTESQKEYDLLSR